MAAQVPAGESGALGGAKWLLRGGEVLAAAEVADSLSARLRGLAGRHSGGHSSGHCPASILTLEIELNRLLAGFLPLLHGVQNVA